MKKMILLGLLCVMSALIYSCNDNPVSNISAFNGQWSVTMKGNTTVASITTGSDYMSFANLKYTGKGSDTNFSGSNTTTSSGATTKTDLSISRNGDNISGSIKIKVIYNSKSTYDSYSFTGKRKK